jgi:hypothetical protein
VKEEAVAGWVGNRPVGMSMPRSPAGSGDNSSWSQERAVGKGFADVAARAMGGS